MSTFRLFQRARTRCLVALLAAMALLTPAFLATSAPPASAIIGGNAVPVGKYPFMVSWGGLSCSAALITPSWVLTAAHCVAGGGTPPTKVVIGGARLSVPSDGETRDVAEVRVHPHWSAATNEYDVALLRLSRPSTRRPLPLIEPSQASAWEAGDSATIAGWGRTSPSGGPPSDLPREVQVPIVSDHDMYWGYGNIFGSPYRPDTMVGAGATGKAGCSGDSGGPLFVSTPRGLRHVGVNSAGTCGEAGKPSVFTETAVVRGWIHENVASADLISVKMNGTDSGRTEVHTLHAGPLPILGAYQIFSLHAAIPVETSSSDTFRFLKGDYNNDGTLDLYVIKLLGASSTEVHVLDGKSNFQHFLLQTATSLHRTVGLQFQFGVGDYNLDGTPDVYAIKMYGTSSGKTEVHVLNGASNYKSFLLQAATGLHSTSGSQFQFRIGDYNVDGKPDLYGIKMNGTSSGKVEVHVLNGAGNYAKFSLQKATTISATGLSQFHFGLGDQDVDSKPDLYAIKMNGTSSGKVEVHVLDGASSYGSFLLQTPTALDQVSFLQFQFATS